MGSSLDFVAWGHKNILASYPSTLEITKSTHLTKRGTCIVALGATRSVADLDEALKSYIRRRDSRVSLSLYVDGWKETIWLRGSPAYSSASV